MVVFRTETRYGGPFKHTLSQSFFNCLSDDVLSVTAAAGVRGMDSACPQKFSSRASLMADQVSFFCFLT